MSKISLRYGNIIICGDFNLPKIHRELPEETTGIDEIMFTELLSDYFQTQLNTTPTRGGNVLDLVITSVPNQVEHVTISDPTQNDLITDHSSIVFNLKTSVKPSPSLDRTIFDYRRGDFDGLRSALQSIDLCSIIQSEGDINLNWLQWKDTFLAAVTDFIPTKRIKGRNTPPWINGEIIHTIRKKETVRQKLKRSPTKSLNDKFKELRTKVKGMVSESRANFFNSLDTTIRLHPKRFWSIFKLKNKTASIPERVNWGNNDRSASSSSDDVTSASTPRNIAELFNNYFISVFSCEPVIVDQCRPLIPP